MMVLMNKQQISLAVIVVVIIALSTIGFLFYWGFGISDGKVEISSVVGGPDPQTQVVKLNKDGAVIETTENGVTETRGLKDFEADEVRTALKDVKITAKSVNIKKVCGKDQPEPDSYLKIKDGKREGVQYFCNGVGGDEDGNINSNYIDVLEVMNDLKGDSSQ
jgi:hypothetical protein